ncbi:MAG: beta-N-acetylhexosaminidase [Clostridia bacterium]|nr:beta-N-acetylhexosaminidase [Clostridia bacterium]
MKFTGDVEEILCGAQILCGGANSGVEVSVQKIAEGFEVYSDGTKYSISYHTPPEFFRGLTILLDKIKKGEKDFCVSQKRHFDTCGVMVDVSRNAVLKVDTVKKLIVYMAKMGFNMMMLYTEDTYKMDKYPYFGYMRGAYTKEEIVEIVKYGEIFGIELVPCIQTLGHLEKTLRWKYADDIKDNDRVLLIDEEKTYELIEEMFKTSRECYHTDKIHIGMDEAQGVGLGNYLRKHGYTNQLELLTRHLNKVVSIAEKYGFKPMMWSDMFFRLTGNSDEYYEHDDSDAGVFNSISDIMPENISMVYWDYYSIEKSLYDLNIARHKKLKREILFAGGVWTWSGLSPNYDKAFITTNAGLTSCRENGITNVIATMWGDDGAECSIFEALLSLQLYGEYNYADEVTEEGLSQMFEICTGYTSEEFGIFNIDDFGDMCEPHDALISKQAFYNDVLMGLFDKNHSLLDLKTHYKDLLDKYEKAGAHGELAYLFEYQKQLLKVLYLKCDIGNRLYSAYAENAKEQMRQIADELIVIEQNINKLHGMLKDIWFKNNKPFGFEHLNYRMGGLCARIRFAAERINDYLNSKTDRIEELEEKRLWYSGEETPFVHVPFADKIMRT